ncbi:MAG: hypothetical protein WD225_05995, partial [Ilumatobacteraceae bacterium]
TPDAWRSEASRVADTTREADPTPAATPSPIPFVLGGRWWQRPTPAGVLALGTLALVVLLPVRGLMRATGSSMEEGFMLLFPRLVQQGWVPNVDFLHLYGPASLHVLALWYWLFGDSLESERVFGLLQHVGIITAMYALTRPWGRAVALISGLVAMFIILTPIGLSALAWHGAIALSLWAIVFAVRARSTDGSTSARAWTVAGILAGLALSYRPDLVVALGVTGWWLVWRRGVTTRVLVGAAIGLVPMWFHLVVAGPLRAFEGMVIDPVFRLRPGRELPVPPSLDRIDGALQAVAEGVPPWWDLPALAARHQLFVWFFATIAIAAAVPLVAWLRRRRGELDGRTTALLAGGLFGIGIISQALQRPDSTHLAWVAVVSWPLMTPIVHDAVRRRASAVVATLTAGAVVAAAMFVVAPYYTYRHYLLHTRVAVGQLPPPFLVERDGRRFWFGDAAVGAAANAMVADLDRLSSPGERLLVGPADLRRTIYSDVAFYWMFPELEPATYYIEMDPGLADAPDSGLADDLLTADWVVLTNFWTGWFEPNASSTFRPNRANEVVADHFCLVDSYEDALVLLYRRCADGDGVSPATLGDRPPPEGGGAPD